MRRAARFTVGWTFGAALCTLAPPAAAEEPAEPAAREEEEEPARTVGRRAEPPGRVMRAYQRALAAKKLGDAEALDRRRIEARLGAAEAQLVDGRRDEAIAELAALVESPGFDAFRGMKEGRAALFLLGDALGRAGAHEPARVYLVPLLEGPDDAWQRRAIRSLIDLALESETPEVFLEELAKVKQGAPAELRGDVAYLEGRLHQKGGRLDRALAAFAAVTPRSRFWAQATYLSGLIEVERGRLKRGEQLFCRVADPKQTPKVAAVHGGNDFFRVRDMARLGLGRVAHEQYRFDDARYYYYLVPADSERVAEALYESANSRYEAKDYTAARELLEELRALEVRHPYEDEAWVFEAYVDLALCEFPKADAKLQQFLRRYEPVRNAARRLAQDEAALRRLVEAVRSGKDPAAAGGGLEPRVARALAVLLRVDGAYGQSARRLAQLDHQASGLQRTLAELDDVRRRLATPDELRPRTEPSAAAAARAKVERLEAEVAELRRLLRDAERLAGPRRGETGPLKERLAALEVRVRAARATLDAQPEAAEGGGEDLEALVAADRRRATELHAAARRARRDLLQHQHGLAKEAFRRLDRRLSRLLRRARLARIETVLGRKRALEVEIEALSQGLLPHGAVDSLDAARYLRDDEEYWPFDGEDWEDEYVGGEGLR